jgi:hypothetical protein
MPAPPPPKVSISRFGASDGSVITLATFRGPVTYRRQYLAGWTRDFITVLAPR